MINRLKNSKAGFTLIELMVCVSIIGILSAIAIPNYLSYRTKGLSVTAKAEASNFYTAALAHFADSSGNVIVTRADCPGFGMNQDILTISDLTDQTITFTATTGDIAITNGTFVHKDGGTTYTLDADGTIS